MFETNKTVCRGYFKDAKLFGEAEVWEPDGSYYKGYFEDNKLIRKID